MGIWKKGRGGSAKGRRISTGVCVKCGDRFGRNVLKRHEEKCRGDVDGRKLTPEQDRNVGEESRRRLDESLAKYAREVVR